MLRREFLSASSIALALLPPLLQDLHRTHRQDGEEYLDCVLCRENPEHKSNSTRD